MAQQELSEPLLEDEPQLEDGPPEPETESKPVSLDVLIERAGHGPFQHRNFALLACCWAIISGMTNTCLPFVTSATQDAWGLTEVEAAGSGVGLQVGALIGVLVAGTLIDKYGRRLVILVASVWATAAHLLCGAGPDWIVLSLFFMLLGMGMIPMQIGAKIWMAEAFSARNRGVWSALLSFFGQFGAATVIGLTYAFNDSEWRMLLVVTALPGVVVVIFVGIYLDETSRYLYLAFGPKKAIEQLESIARQNHVQFDTVSSSQACLMVLFAGSAARRC